VAELRERGLNDRFAAYMRSWAGFVARLRLRSLRHREPLVDVGLQGDLGPAVVRLAVLRVVGVGRVELSVPRCRDRVGIDPLVIRKDVTSSARAVDRSQLDL
jgi:hypothetical protein